MNLQRRTLLRSGSLVLALGVRELAWGATILNVRVWPAPDYSRVTIESDAELRARQQFVPNPPRLAVDIEDIQLNAALRELVAKVKPDDPNIAGIRVGQFTPTLVRLVVDLKVPARPQVFTLAPVAAYRHRLVFDLYPEQEADPMAALLQGAQAALQGEARMPVPGMTALPAARPQAAGSAAQAAVSAPASHAVSTPASAAGSASARAGGVDPLGEFLAQRLGDRPAPATASASAPALAMADRTRAGAGASASAPSAASAVSAQRLIIVALDPGHGGEDPGAIGPAGTREKDVVLRLAFLLRDRINASTLQGQPLRAFLTRDADFFVPLGVRVQKARRVQADLFMSLHADAFYTPDPQGASVFALSQGGASSSAARWMAARENKADEIGGLNIRAQDVNVQRALLDMSTSAQIKESLVLGGTLLGEIRRVGKLHKPRVEQASFAVLKAPDIPSVLVEAAFISNPREEAKLNDEAYLNQLADALMRGILAYFTKNPPAPRERTVS